VQQSDLLWGLLLCDVPLDVRPLSKTHGGRAAGEQVSRSFSTATPHAKRHKEHIRPSSSTKMILIVCKKCFL
jgi:hypothetical protein